jgi:hypothetical protein
MELFNFHGDIKRNKEVKNGGAFPSRRLCLYTGSKFTFFMKVNSEEEQTARLATRFSW